MRNIWIRTQCQADTKIEFHSIEIRNRGEPMLLLKNTAEKKNSKVSRYLYAYESEELQVRSCGRVGSRSFVLRYKIEGARAHR